MFYSWYIYFWFSFYFLLILEGKYQKKIEKKTIKRLADRMLYNNSHTSSILYLYISAIFCHALLKHQNMKNSSYNILQFVKLHYHSRVFNLLKDLFSFFMNNLNSYDCSMFFLYTHDDLSQSGWISKWHILIQSDSSLNTPLPFRNSFYKKITFSLA